MLGEVAFVTVVHYITKSIIDMGDFMDSLVDWESKSLASLLCTAAKWFNADDIELRIVNRPEVASRIWITCSVMLNGQKRYIDGQSPDIVQRRLVDLMDRLELGGSAREDLLNRKRLQNNTGI